MTARLIFQILAVELGKVLAPTLKLFEFNHYINKAITLYTNKIYNIYDTSLQTTDDLRVLTNTAYLKVNKTTKGDNYETYLPLDYFHLLNCICIYHVEKTNGCYKADSSVQVPATKLIADSWGSIIDNVYNRPSAMKPYYYIHNTSTSNFPTNPIVVDNNTPSGYNGTDINGEYKVTSLELQGVASDNEAGSNFNRTFKLTSKIVSSIVEKPIASRIGNISNVRLEIRCGNSSNFLLEEVLVDYLKVPQYIRLTQEQIDLTQDTSQIMEFPDYVCYEIINELVHLIMLHTHNPQLSDHFLITSTIARPTQQL